MAAEISKKTDSHQDLRDFHEQLKAILPRLRVYALSLTRDRDAADDLVHDTVIKALTGRKSFEPGTNLSAWVFRIQRNNLSNRVWDLITLVLFVAGAWWIRTHSIYSGMISTIFGFAEETSGACCCRSSAWN